MAFKMKGFSGFGSPFNIGKGASKAGQQISQHVAKAKMSDEQKSNLMSNIKEKALGAMDGDTPAIQLYKKGGKWIEDKIKKAKPDSVITKYINWKNKIKEKYL